MALVFDVSADIAIFRKAYTTTSQASFAFPPPTAAAGLICAIAGIEHHDAAGTKLAAFWDSLRGTRIAIGIRRPVRWLATAVNLLKFKSNNGSLSEHIQSRHQFLKKPAYRIYVDGGSVYNLLKERLENQEFVYTPFLGVAYALADIQYRGEYPLLPLDDTGLCIDTILPDYPGLVVDFHRSISIYRDVIPFQLDEKRNLQGTVGVFYTEVLERHAVGIGISRLYHPAPIWLKSPGSVDISRVDNDHVAWFQAFH